MRSSARHLRQCLTLGLSLAWLCVSSASWAVPVLESERIERKEPLPKRIQEVDLVEHLGNSLPLDLIFRNTRGEATRLETALGGDLPTILTFNYSDCPMLCSLQLNGLVSTLKKLDWNIGEQFRLLTVGLNPKESANTAAGTQARYLRQYGRPTTNYGWKFLTGDEASIHALADAVGLQYTYNEARDEYLHPAVITLLSPQAKITRYLYGLDYLPETLRLSLVEASEGRVGSTIDRLILYCFHYDASEGRYAPVARNVMQLGGAVALTGLILFLSLLWKADRRRQRLAESTPI